ncbi:MAG TPA: aspartate 1-decarboxylase [Bacteroidales bacterium]|nr:aspartate 1-decarboxylase [Bacteroidales bacterium]
MIQIEILKSKIHRATVTDANLNYIGSITIDGDLIDAANLIEFEKVQVLNINNGERFETYVIRGKHGSGEVVLNGAAARMVQPGDLLIICAFAMMPVDEAKNFKPVIIFPNSQNKLS